MITEIANLYKRYRTYLKPLVAEFESQNEVIMPTCLVDLSNMFDRIALCETAQEPNEQTVHLEKASAHLESAIKNTLDGVIAGHIQKINKFRQTYSQGVMNAIKEGDFIGHFTALDQEAHEAMRNNRFLAYEKLDEMVDMINDAHTSALTISQTKDNKQILVLKGIISILISIIVTALIAYLW